MKPLTTACLREFCLQNSVSKAAPCDQRLAPAEAELASAALPHDPAGAEARAEKNLKKSEKFLKKRLTVFSMCAKLTFTARDEGRDH